MSDNPLKLFGHQSELKMLCHTIDGSEMGQSFLLSGPEMIGKYKLAQDIALSYLKDPASKDSHIHIVELAEDSTSISIDQIRATRKWLQIATPSGEKRFVIINNAHLMTTEAQNAFLKTLEEPPLSTFCFMVSHVPMSILPTIRSRLMQIALQPASSEIVSEFLADKPLSQNQKKYLMTFAQGRIGLMKKIIDNPDVFKLIGTARADFISLNKGERLLMIPEIIKIADPSFMLYCWIMFEQNHMTQIQSLTHLNNAYQSLQYPSPATKLIFEKLALALPVIQ